MTTPKKVIHAATSEIGYKENPPSSNSNKFGVWYELNFAPWSCIFVSYCFYTAGLPLKITTDKGFSYAPFAAQWFKDNGWWRTSPQAGDIVFYDFDNDGIANHVGIVENVNVDSSIIAIEGNTSAGSDSSGGQVMRRTRDDSRILGYGRPNYQVSV
jgi:hypothetical protein